jgi:hypothetical protein
MNNPPIALPLGRWIYSTDSPNSTGKWFFVGEQVHTPTTPPSTHTRLQQQDMSTQTEISPLSNTSTDDLITELMKRSPDEQKRLIMQSLDIPQPAITSNNSTQTTPEAANSQAATTTDTEQSTENTTDYTLDSINRDVEEMTSMISQESRSWVGLNEPKLYKPIITITPPHHDPELSPTTPKKQKPNTESYDPSNPSMTPKDKHYTIMKNGLVTSIVCNECRRTFGNRGSFSRHYSSHHTDIHYECLECGLITLRRDSLKKHYADKHPETQFKEGSYLKRSNTTNKPVKFNIKPKHTVKELNLNGNISPNLMAKLQQAIKEHNKH